MDEASKRILLIGEPLLDVTEEVIVPNRVRSAVRSAHKIYQYKGTARTALGGVFYLARFLSHFSKVDILFPHPKAVDSSHEYSERIDDLKQLDEYTVHPIESIHNIYRVRRTLWVQSDSATDVPEAVPILRVDSAIPSRAHRDEEKQIIEKLKVLLPNQNSCQYDAVLIADYDLGLFTDGLVQQLSDLLTDRLPPGIDIIVYAGKRWGKYSCLHKGYIVSDYEEALGVLDTCTGKHNKNENQKNDCVRSIAKCFPSLNGVVLVKSCNVHTGFWKIHGNKISGKKFNYIRTDDCKTTPTGYRGLTAAWLALGLTYGCRAHQALASAHEAAILGQLNLKGKLSRSISTIKKLNQNLQESQHLEATDTGKAFDITISPNAHPGRTIVPSSTSDEIIQVMICYPSKLEEVMNKIRDMFIIPIRKSEVRVVCAENVSPGDEWEQIIRADLKNSDLIILLMSVDFIKSTHCMNEMEYAIQCREEGRNRGVKVVPVMCDYISKSTLEEYADLNKLERLPKKKNFLTEYKPKFAGYDEIAYELLEVVARIRNERKAVPKNLTELDRVKRTYRNERVELTRRIMEYYSKHCKGLGLNLFYEQSGIPVLSKKEWIPEVPIPLKYLDQLISLEEDKADFLPPQNRSFITNRNAKETDKHYNGDLYRLLDFDGIRFKFCRGKYFDFLDTCECLGLELAKAFNQDKLSPKGQVDRDVLSARNATDVLNFKDRATAFGTCTLVVIKQYDGNHTFLLNMRSKDLSETPGLFHVVPAGTFQPALNNATSMEEDFSFTQNIFREFVEELIDDEYLRYDPGKKSDFKGMLKSEARDFINKVKERESYELWYLGTVLDPVNLKPEILTIMFIDERDTPHWKQSWETNTGEGGLVLESFTEEQIKNVLNKYHLVPTGRAHLYLIQEKFGFLENRLDSFRKASQKAGIN